MLLRCGESNRRTWSGKIIGRGHVISWCLSFAPLPGLPFCQIQKLYHQSYAKGIAIDAYNVNSEWKMHRRYGTARILFCLSANFSDPSWLNRQWRGDLVVGPWASFDEMAISSPAFESRRFRNCNCQVPTIHAGEFPIYTEGPILSIGNISTPFQHGELTRKRIKN